MFPSLVAASAVTAVTAAASSAAAAVVGAGRGLEGFERSGDQFTHRLVRRAGNARQRDYSGGRERPLCTRTDIAADDGVHAVRQEPKRDIFMSASARFTRLRRHDIIRDGVYLKLRRPTEVLKDLSVKDRDGDSGGHFWCCSWQNSCVVSFQDS